MEHGTRKHALYGGSAIDRIILCPGSVKLASVAPYREPSVHSKEGTAAHELLDACLRDECFDAEFGLALYGLRPVYDTVEENRFQAEEAVRSVQVVLDYVLNLLECYEDAVLHVEKSFKLPSIDEDNTWGTSDICVYVSSLSLMYVVDFKHGAGEVVDLVTTDGKGRIVYENGQTLYYATGCYYSGMQADTICLAIIQPRAVHSEGSIRERIVAAPRLVSFLGQVNDAIAKAQQDDAPLNPGAKQCRWCPANLTCPARERQALQVVGTSFKSFRDIGAIPLPRPADMPMDRLVHILKSKALVTKFFQDVEDYAYEFARNGGNIFDYKLVEAQARRHWYGKDEDVAVALMQLIGTSDWDDVYPRKLINITEAEKVVAKAFKDRLPRGQKKQAAEQANEALAALTLKESSGNLVLVPIDDRRPAANRAAQSFANVQVLPPPPKA